jgi:hypothetical protein
MAYHETSTNVLKILYTDDNIYDTTSAATVDGWTWYQTAETSASPGADLNAFIFISDTLYYWVGAGTVFDDFSISASAYIAK